MKTYSSHIIFVFFSTLLWSVTAHSDNYELKSDYPWYGILLKETYCPSIHKTLTVGTKVIVVGKTKKQFWLHHEDGRFLIEACNIDELLVHNIEDMLTRKGDRSYLSNFSKLTTIDRLLYDSIEVKEPTEKPVIYLSLLADMITTNETTLSLDFSRDSTLFCAGDLKKFHHFSNRAEINDIHFQRGDLIHLEGEERWIGIATGRAKEVILLREKPKGTICVLQQPVDTFIEVRCPESTPKLSVFNPIWHEKLLHSKAVHHSAQGARSHTKTHHNKPYVYSQHFASSGAIKKSAEKEVSLPDSFKSPQQGTITPVADATPLTKSLTTNPQASYVYMIAKAIQAQPDHQASLKTICEWIGNNYQHTDKIGNKKDSRGWKNSIRHNLSLYSSFVRIKDKPRASLWCIDDYEKLMDKFDKTPARRKRIKRNRTAKSTTHQETALAGFGFGTTKIQPLLTNPWTPTYSTTLPQRTGFGTNLWCSMPQATDPSYRALPVVMRNPQPDFSSLLEKTAYSYPPPLPSSMQRWGYYTESEHHDIENMHHINCTCISCQDRYKSSYSSGYQIEHH